MSEAHVIRHLIVHVIIVGRVQGVGFRAFVDETALRHGIAGWVRNRRDGSVEAVFAGSAAEVEAVIAACHKGPPGSRVDALHRREGTESDLSLAQAGRFSVLPTA